MAGPGVAQAWYWRSVDADRACDPGEVPASADEHERRIKNGLWGPRLARLRPATIKELKKPLVVVKDHLDDKDIEVPMYWQVTWMEGLLVLDSVLRSGTPCVWLDQKILEILEREKAKYKDNVLRASLYVEQKGLLQVAVTGKPVYRRKPLKDDAVPDGPPGDPYYQIQGLVAYLPPWEAFVHPKCGLYQDWYLVQWAAPHHNEDYSKTEHGGDQPGTTWEPDEVLPVSLDKLRVAAKRRWVEKQKVKEQNNVGTDRSATKAKKRPFNALKVELFDDIANPGRGHGWSKPPGEFDEAQIKKDWPKTEKEFPPGHRSAGPPGFCSEKCDCMEDWHIGNTSGEKPWLQDRESYAQTAVNFFEQVGAQQQILRRRGMVSGTHYFEALTNAPRTDPPDHAACIDITRLIWRSVGEASTCIPLSALQGADTDSKSLLTNCVYIFSTCGQGQAPVLYVPVQYRVFKGPPWIYLDSETGRSTIFEPVSEKNTVQLHLEFLDINGNPQKLPFSIVCTAPPQLPGRIKANTNALAKKLLQLKEPALRARTTDMMKEVYDFDRQQPWESQRLGCWARVMRNVASLTRAFPRGGQIQLAT